MTWNRGLTLRVVFVGVAVALVAMYLRLMMGFTATPVVPYQIATALPALPGPTLTVAQRTAPRGSFDFPQDGANVIAETQVRGWAIDAASDHDSGVDSVQLLLDGNYLADATYGQDRQDVGASFGDRFGASGWTAQLDLSDVALGPHTLEARAHSSFSDRTTNYTTHIVLSPIPSQPHGAVDAPSDQAAVEGVVEMSGWAIDQSASNGAGIDEVKIYLDGSPVATASYGLSRPDVAAGYGSHFANAGWQARIDLSGAGTGRHQLEARAHSTVEDTDASYSITVLVGPSGG